MAACGSLQHIFEKPLPENPTLLESLSSWKQIKSPKLIEESTFTEIFGELHFKEKPSLCSPSSSPHRIEKSNATPLSDYFSPTTRKPYAAGCHRNNDSFSSMNSESLQLCTESLGFESSDDVEDLKADISSSWRNQDEDHDKYGKHESIVSSSSLGDYFKRSRTRGGGGGGELFPPPISSIGKSGKPWVCFKSYRQEGRFVLKEIRVPTPEFLHARREDGRLKLQLLQSDDEILEEDEDDEEEEENEEDKQQQQLQEEEEEYSEEKNVIQLSV